MPRLSVAVRSSLATDRNIYQAIVTPAAGTKLQVFRIKVDKVQDLVGGQIVRFRFGTAGTQFETHQLLGQNGVKVPLVIEFGSHPQDGPFWIEGAAGEALRMQIFDAAAGTDTAPTDIHATIYYRQVAA